MEGCPLHSYEGLDHISGRYTQSFIEDLNAHVPPGVAPLNTEDPTNIVSQIGNELYMGMQGTFKEPVDPDDETLVKHVQLVEEFNDVYKRLYSEFMKSIERVNVAEETLKQSYETTHKSLDTIRKFSSFLNTLDTGEHEELQKMMVVLSEKIKNEDTLQKTKENYQKELYILQNYLYKFLKPLNAGNMGNTCSLCLQKPVDTFMNPCGHTGCAECIQKLREMEEGHQTSCFLCRKSVNSFHKLYFC